MPKALTQEQLDAMAAGVDLTAGDTTTSAQNGPDEQGQEEDQSAANAAEATATVVTMVLTAEVASLTAKLAEVEATVSAASEDMNALAEIVQASVRTMGMHFGVKADAVAAMSSKELLAEHARVGKLFKEKFKVGGVAATTQEAAPAKAVVPPMFAAVMKSTHAN